MIRASALALPGLAAALVACAGSTAVFATNWTDDGGASIDAVRKRLASHLVPPGADVAVGVAGHGARIIGLPLGSGDRWTFAHALDARPVIAGHLVVASGAGDIFALDAKTGRLVWSIPTDGLSLRGAGDDGTTTAVTTTGAHGSALLAITRDGKIAHRFAAPRDVGAPAVVDGLAFVPWSYQYVSAVDLSSGDEAGRVVLREKTSHAWTSGGALYFGEIGVFRFDDAIRDAARGRAHHLAVPSRPLPGRPLFLRPAEDAQRPEAGAADKIRLYARPSLALDPLSFDSGRVYATYFRLVFGLSAPGGKLAWVHTHPRTILGGDAASGAFVACDEGGKLTVLDAATGALLGDTLDLGEPLESCTVQIGEWKRGGATEGAAPLVEQIRVALTDRDLELGAAQVMLVHDLASVPDERATALLIQTTTDPRTPSSLQGEARTALASRRNGARFMLEALARRFDFLHDVTSTPPVGALAQALAAMGDPAAAPALAAHLFEPADSDADLRDVAQALSTLATPAELPALLRFFAFYRDAPADPDEIPVAVSAIADAILRVGGKEGRAAIDVALQDRSLNPTVRAKLQALIDASALQRATPSTTPSSTSRE